MDSELIITLQNYGLSEKEAKVYLTALELGSSPASTIARRSEIKRVTVYTILNDLKKDGIVNETTKEDVKYYSVITPDNLLRQLEQKYESFKEKIPELMALADKFGNRPKVQFFEGLEWMKRMYDDLLTSDNEEISSFLWIQDMDPILEKDLFNGFVPKRVKLGIHAKVIVSKQDQNIQYKRMDKKLLKETRMIEKDTFSLNGEINIYWDNKVGIAMFNNKEISWVIIHSKTTHDNLKNIFGFIWDGLK